MTKSDEEIIDRVEKHSVFDIFATFFDLVECLPFEKAKKFLKEDTWEESEKKWVVMPRDRDAVIDRMKEYMIFALIKMEDHRGLSASRSIMHFKHWLWLIGDEDLLRDVIHDDGPYRPYGGPMLKAICEKYGFSMPNSDAPVRMLNGKSCREDCDEGCQ